MDRQIQSTLETLRSSVIEGRAENVRFRLDQLNLLHTSLLSHVDEICKSLSIESSSSQIQAETEFFLATDAVKRIHETLDFDQSLKDEYQVTTGKDNAERRAAIGLVVIRPSEHSRLYSIINPVAAALASGNCILLELDGASSYVDKILSRILSQTLPSDVFAVSFSKLSEDVLSWADVLVDQLECHPQTSSLTLSPPKQNLVVAIVDRTGDLKLAAKLLLQARSQPHQFSSYSPDLVIVNEYLCTDFVDTCRKYMSLQASSKPQVFTTERQAFEELLSREEKGGKVKVHRSGSEDITIIEVLDKSSAVAQQKIDGSYLVLLPSTGMVDSVTALRSLTPLLATYLFADPSVCKFLAEQVPSQTTYINQIPTELLVGPSSPVSHPHSLHPRYLPSMFSNPRPQYIIPVTYLPDTSKLRAMALTKLNHVAQRPGKALGFFEQGILLGLGSAALLVVPLVSWGLFTSGKALWRLVQARLI
ncbi:Aldehyde/histidinol dehydrogenase [Tricladium varicosporioides]|nr:Aldehyde/histidinol dehydrogenase [Hymenoscyphus varicosporioides]